MHQQLVNRLGLVASASEVTQSVSMGDYNTIQCEIVTFFGAVDITYQQSNDLENWDNVVAEITTITVPYDLLASQTITAAYARISVKAEAGGTAVVSLGVNLSSQ